MLKFTCIRTFLRFSPKPYRRQYYVFDLFSPRSCRRRIMGYFGKQSPKHYFGFQHAGQNSMESGYDYVWQYRMPYIVFEKYLMWLFYSSNNLGWFACFRIQFLPDHIMIHSCLVCDSLYDRYYVWYTVHICTYHIHRPYVYLGDCHQSINRDWQKTRIASMGIDAIIELKKYTMKQTVTIFDHGT